MELCSGGVRDDSHDEIVYDGNSCPLCAEMESRKEAEKERDKLQEELNNIE